MIIIIVIINFIITVIIIVIIIFIILIIIIIIIVIILFSCIHAFLVPSLVSITTYNNQGPVELGVHYGGKSLGLGQVMKDKILNCLPRMGDGHDRK